MARLKAIIFNCIDNFGEEYKYVRISTEDKAAEVAEIERDKSTEIDTIEIVDAFDSRDNENDLIEAITRIYDDFTKKEGVDGELYLSGEDIYITLTRFNGMTYEVNYLQKVNGKIGLFDDGLLICYLDDTDYIDVPILKDILCRIENNN